MDRPLIDLINARICEAKEAKEASDFDHLAGAGKPSPPEGDPENTLPNRLARGKGAVPEFVSLSRKPAKLREDLADTGDRTRRRGILKELSMLGARVDIVRKRWTR